MFAHAQRVWSVIQYQPDAVRLVNVSQTPIVPAMLRVKMLVARIHVKIRISAAEMHCALFGLIRLCASVLETPKEIHIMNVLLLNVPTTRTVIYPNRASIQNALIRVPCPILVDRMLTAMSKIMSAFVLVILVQPVIHCWAAYRCNIVTATINANLELFATMECVVPCAHRIANA